MNIWHYRDNHDNWLYYRDGKFHYRTALLDGLACGPAPPS